MPDKRRARRNIPMIPVRGLVVYPHMMAHFDVGRPSSLRALEAAMMKDQEILLFTQREESLENPAVSDLYDTGTLVEIKQVMNLPGENMRVLVEGVCRARPTVLSMDGEYPSGNVHLYFDEDQPTSRETEASANVTRMIFEQYASDTGRLPPETVSAVSEMEHPGEMADAIAGNTFRRIEDRQSVLDELLIPNRLQVICDIISREGEMAELEKSIQARVRQQVDKNQKDYYLREQIKAIQVELGDGDGAEVEELRERLARTPLNDEARQKAEKELERLSRMAPGTPDITISRNYIEWILDLPWGVETEDNLDIKRARQVLARNHYGLEKVKERIVEYLAVLRMKQDMKGPILCFVGPPGVGKTSIVRDIAEAVGRKFVQMSLGGVRDEAEIRGHRRTYIGAIPGRIISGMKQAGSMNPVFLFDEIDKMAHDFRGDPASAMLEVLDAEQNHAFRDHYMELPFDLSKVMFITTANTVDGIPAPLLDRMELIEVPSYTEEEKLQIAKRHLLPKQIAAHGIAADGVRMTDSVLKSLIEDYTREAGVRTLERTIARVVRKAAVTMLDTGAVQVKVTEKALREYLGAARYLREKPGKEPRVGVVNGLAYTTVGGEMLEVECSTMPGKGSLQLTGQLGSVMKESAEAAFSWVRAHSDEMGLPKDFYKDQDIHIHVPEGAVPKDGPSAGVTMATALTSALTGVPVRQDVAMTGEITLRGRVLPIGGLKEKTLAAYRSGITTLMIPKENVKDLEDVPAYVMKQFRVVTAEQIGDVLRTALVRMPGKE